MTTPSLEQTPADRPSSMPAGVTQHSATGGRTLEMFSNTPKINQWIYSKLASGVRGDVLEIGSGIGNLSRLIVRDADRAVLTDMEPHYLEALRHELGDGDRVQVARFDLDEEPPPEVARRRFDAIVAVNVIEHLRNDLEAVGRLAALLKDGGKLLIYVPACPFVYGKLDESLGHYRRYTPASLTAVLEAVGLQPTPPRYMNALGLVGWFLNGRILQQRLIPAAQLRLMERMVDILRLEDRVRLPIGLNLITQATKVAAAGQGDDRRAHNGT
jgi:SAM-dependent methyltransferase